MIRRGGVKRAVIQISVAVVALAACSSPRALDHRTPGPSSAALVRRVWRLIHPTDSSRVLLIDVAQDTRNALNPCWVQSATRVSASHGAFYITLRQGTLRQPPSVECPALAVRGPFYATVRLPRPYTGQTLIDTVSRRPHAPGSLVRLESAPGRFR